MNLSNKLKSLVDKGEGMAWNPLPEILGEPPRPVEEKFFVWKKFIFLLKWPLVSGCNVKLQ